MTLQTLATALRIENALLAPEVACTALTALRQEIGRSVLVLWTRFTLLGVAKAVLAEWVDAGDADAGFHGVSVVAGAAGSNG